MDRRGVEPRPLVCKTRVIARDPQPITEVRPGIEPGPPPYQGGMPPEHLQTFAGTLLADGAPEPTSAVLTGVEPVPLLRQSSVQSRYTKAPCEPKARSNQLRRLESNQRLLVQSQGFFR